MVFDGRTDLVGRTIAGRYALQGVIGRGGMATVYRAYQEALDRAVAVKVIAANLAHDPDFAERFRREARTVARLRHPNILTVHDFGEESGLLYLVTELIGGGTLQSRLTEARAPERALDLIAQVGAALDFAHAQGIVHRDVKPLNIFLDGPNGEQAILADFGIAKATQQAGEATGGLTGTGLSIGTPEYMAPEQITGGEIDGRADLYALAVIAYQLLAGRLPLARGGPHDTPIALAMRKVQTLPPAPSTFNPNLSGATDRVLLRALATEPSGRFATAADFVGALRAALAVPNHPAPPRVGAAGFTPQRPTWEYPPPVNLTPTVQLPSGAPPPERQRPTEAVPPYQPPAPPYQPPAPSYQPPAQPRFTPPPTSAAPLAAPGAYAQVAQAGGTTNPPPAAGRRAWLPLAGGLAALLVACFLIGVFGRGVLGQFGIGAGPTATQPLPTGVAIGPIAGGTRTVGPEPSTVATSTQGAALPATPSAVPSASASPTATVPSPSPSAPPVTPSAAPAPSATPAPAATPAPSPTPASTSAPSARPSVAPSAVASAAPSPSAAPSVAGSALPLPVASGPPTGQLLYSSNKEGRWAIYRLKPDGSGERRLTELNADNYHGVWSPDGGRVAFVSERDGNPEIYLMNPDGGEQRRLTSDGGEHADPVWSGDGTRVAYVLSTGGTETVYFLEIATNRRTGLINSPAAWPAWSSKDAIAWTRLEGGFVTIYLSTVTGSTSSKLPRTVNQSEDTPAFSPDGNLLAFTSGSKNDRQIVVSTASGQNRRAISARGADNSNPVWSPDGAYIAYSSTASGTQQLVIMKNDGTEARTITSGAGAKWYLSWR